MRDAFLKLWAERLGENHGHECPCNFCRDYALVLERREREAKESRVVVAVVWLLLLGAIIAGVMGNP